MPSHVRDVMTKDPVALARTVTAADAARAMRDSDIGAVVVLDGETACGIVTDRDITVRAVAEGADPSTVELSSICTKNPSTISPDASLDEALALMRREDIRRLLVVEGDRPVGIVSLGDVSVERDAGDARADISSAPANN